MLCNEKQHFVRSPYDFSLLNEHASQRCDLVCSIAEYVICNLFFRCWRNNFDPSKPVVFYFYLMNIDLSHNCISSILFRLKKFTPDHISPDCGLD